MTYPVNTPIAVTSDTTRVIGRDLDGVTRRALAVAKGNNKFDDCTSGGIEAISCRC